MAGYSTYAETPGSAVVGFDNCRQTVGFKKNVGRSAAAMQRYPAGSLERLGERVRAITQA
jgi:hypothetical protein